MKIRFFAILLFILGFNTLSYSQSGLELAYKMISTVKSLQTLQCTVDSKERVLGKIYPEVNNFKINITPFKAYFKQEKPQPGLEGLLVSGANSNKIKINPNAFPWVNLNLDPEGDLIMKNRHHPVYHAGYGYVADVLERLLNKYKDKSDQLIVSKGLFTYMGQDIWIIECNNPFYKIQTYTVTKPETVYNLSMRLYINFCSILEENPDLKLFSEIPAGKTIKIPSDFASKMTIYLHKTQFYPLYIKVMDPKGMFEEYKFTNVVLNPVFKADTFADTNPEYHF